MPYGWTSSGPSAAPALAALTARLPAGADGPSAASALAGAFDGSVSLKGFGVGADEALAPGLPELEAKTRALFRRYLPRLYRDLPVRYEYAESKFGGGGGHDFAPESGHLIALIPGAADARGDVPSAVGEAPRIRVQSKIEQLFTSVHEYAHAVFDDATDRTVGERPAETAYDAMTEGFAVTVEQVVLEGMLRDAAALGLTPRDAADVRAILAKRRAWLQEQDSTAYAEGVPVWGKAWTAGGEDALLALLGALKAERLMAVRRADALYQLSLAGPETARAYLGDGRPAALRAGFDAAARASVGLPLSPADRAAASAALDAAGPDGWERLIRSSLLRERDFGDPGEPQWIVPAFLRRAADLTAPLLRLAGACAGLAERVAASLSGAAARPDGLTRVFEEPGPSERLLTIVSGAESLPWAADAKKAWDAAVRRWIAP